MNTKQTNNLEVVRELLIIWRSYTGEEISIPKSSDELEALKEALRLNADAAHRAELSKLKQSQLIGEF